MGPSSTRYHSSVRRCAVLLGALIFPCSLACEGEKKEEEEEKAPTEPWLKDAKKRPAEDAPVRARFQVTSESSLGVSLPARLRKPSGQLSQVEGFVDFDLKDLAQTSGRIHISLASLQMNNLLPPDNAEKVEEARELYSDATGEALRWLGLGANVPDNLKRENSLAVFQLNSLRGLSHASARTGSLRASPGGGTNRQVSATAEGELSLRGFSVSRTFGTTLLFHYANDSAELPDSVTVTVRNGAVIPLAEYEIAPRGPGGSLDTKKSALLGTWVGQRVHVTGTLFLSRAGTTPETLDRAKTPD